MNKNRSSKNQNASALIAVIITIAILSLLAGAFTSNVNNRRMTLSQGSAWQEALVAAEAGAHLTPRACRRVLRGVVFTGEAPLFLRRDLDDDSVLVRPLRGAPPGVSRVQLWWPSGKIAGRLNGKPETVFRGSLEPGAGIQVRVLEPGER